MNINNKLGFTEAVEAMRNQEQRMNQVSNNLANVNTVGYKKQDNTFWEMLVTRAGEPHRVGKTLQETTDFSPGPLQQTGNNFDLAIGGRGFFRIQTPEGVRYTRAGDFQLNNQGQLVTPNGHLLLGEGGTVVIEPDAENVVITRDGGVWVDGRFANRITVADFNELDDLEKQGGNLFRIREGGGAEIEAAGFSINQGFLESSNVNSTEEMVDMIELYRIYESQQRAITTIDSINGQAVRSVGKLTP